MYKLSTAVGMLMVETAIPSCDPAGVMITWKVGYQLCSCIRINRRINRPYWRTSRRAIPANSNINDIPIAPPTD
jgi:hypothetical protein